MIIHMFKNIEIFFISMHSFSLEEEEEEKTSIEILKQKPRCFKKRENLYMMT